MFKIEITDNQKLLNKNLKELIKKIGNIIFDEEKLKGKIIFELHIIDNEYSQFINKNYRNKDYPTDVISFSFWEEGLFKTNLLGEIYLNYNKLIAQSDEYEHSVEREFAFLFSHGIYHLLGYDHQTKDEEKIMLSKQYKVLKICGLGKENDNSN